MVVHVEGMHFKGFWGVFTSLKFCLQVPSLPEGALCGDLCQG